jgi:hypothetical protein
MKIFIVIVTFLMAADAAAARRALLIGINDYSAPATMTRVRHAPPPPGREWPTLFGAVNDVGILQEMLVQSYGFPRENVVTLTDHAATRDAILESIERHLIAPAAKDDVLFFYYAGHGSQIRNSRSDEPDQLDESIVPADSRLGAPDIRDKELRRLFNRILDKDARLTVMMDNCHSGSGARGLSNGAMARGVRSDPRDLRDATDYGPRPESRGALVLSATQDFGRAWEMRDADGQMHGVFTWAFLRALRDAPGGEAAADTFLRADARMRSETPFQEPVLAGSASARSAPFLGTRIDRRGERTVVAVEKVQSDGTVLLQGGWANGLAVGTELRDGSTRVAVTAMRGLARSEGRLLAGKTHSGALLEVAAWTPPRARPLRVWMPRAPGDLVPLARRIAAEASKRRLRWVSDPTEAAEMHLLRWNGGEWEALDPDGTKRTGNDPLALMARMRAGSSLFVQFPGPAISVDGIVAVARADAADYLLAGRYAGGKLSYAWVRPNGSSRRSALPVRSAWVSSAAALREHAQRLRRIQMWQFLESPPGSRAPYRLALRRAKDRTFISNGTVVGDERYELVVRAASQQTQPRYVYAFVIDSHGKSTLLHPRDGSVENRLTGGQPQISLGDFHVGPPYGIDTFVLLTTDEPLPSPWILTWDGVRTGPFDLAHWSIERVLVESVPPRRH